MSRRQRTTLVLQVRIPLPPGASAKAAIEFVVHALAAEKSATPVQQPMASLQLPEIGVRLEKRETHYL